MRKIKQILKKILFLLLMIFCFTEFELLAQDSVVDYERLITAIGTVESGMDDNAVNGVYAGFLQISTILVEECNRINKIRGKSERYTLDDRFSHEKSIEMFHLIQDFHNNSKEDTLHYAILLWNEGTSAMNRPIRKTKYYHKVMEIYNKCK